MNKLLRFLHNPLIIFTLIVFPALTAARAGAVANVRIINLSAPEICYVYISTSTSQDWGDDWLGEDVTLAAGDAYDIRLTEGTYDFLLEDCDHSTILEKYSQKINGKYDLKVTGIFQRRDMPAGGVDRTLGYFSGRGGEADDEIKTPAIRINNFADVEAGDTASISLDHFRPGEKVTLHLYKETSIFIGLNQKEIIIHEFLTTLGTVKIDSRGQGKYDLPTSTADPSGEYSISAVSASKSLITLANMTIVNGARRTVSELTYRDYCGQAKVIQTDRLPFWVDGDKAAEIPRGTKLTLSCYKTEFTNGAYWVLVKYNQTYGWVQSDFLELVNGSIITY